MAKLVGHKERQLREGVTKIKEKDRERWRPT